MKKTVIVHMDEAQKEALQRQAKKEGRTLSNLVRHLLKEMVPYSSTTSSSATN